MIKLLELFGGIGACSKALDRLGIDYEIADYVEIDKYAVKSYNAIHNTNFEPQDIRSWDKDIEVDLIMHGSPCQDFSLAGKQAGGDKDSGTRSSLMYETIRIIEKLNPTYVVWENVKNLLSKKHIHNFNNYLKALEDLGYQNYYQVLNAKDYGIPQNRERVFTVSILKESIIYDDYNSNIRKDQDTIGTLTTNCGSSTIRNGWKIIEHKQYFQFPEKQELKKLPIDLIEENVDKKYDLTENNVKTYQREFGSKGKELNLYEPIPTLTASMGTGGGNIPYFEFPPKQELKLKLKDMLEDNVDEKYYLSDKQLTYVLDGNDVALKSGRNINDRIVNSQIAKTISCRGACDQRADVTNFVVDNCNEELKVKDVKLKIKNATKKGYLEAYEGDGVNISSRMKYQRGNVQTESIQTLTTSGGNDRGVVVNDKPQVIGGLGEKDSNGGRQWKQQNRIYDNNVSISVCTSYNPYYPDNKLRIRKLTPKECWRLMGFDDEDVDKCIKAGISNAQLYKQAGNSIVVNVLEEIFKQLFLNN